MAKSENTKVKDNPGFNLADLFIILMIIVCIAGFVLRATNTKIFGSNTTLEQYELVFSVSNIEYTFEDAFVRDDTVSLNDGTIIGTIDEIKSILPASTYVEDEAGNIVSVNYPESTRIDVNGIILAQGQMVDGRFYADGSSFIASGVDYSVRTEHADFVLRILDIVKK